MDLCMDLSGIHGSLYGSMYDICVWTWIRTWIWVWTWIWTKKQCKACKCYAFCTKIFKNVFVDVLLQKYAFGLKFVSQVVTSYESFLKVA